jgi:hypothetical protein
LDRSAWKNETESTSPNSIQEFGPDFRSHEVWSTPWNYRNLKCLKPNFCAKFLVGIGNNPDVFWLSKRNCDKLSHLVSLFVQDKSFLKSVLFLKIRLALVERLFSTTPIIIHWTKFWGTFDLNLIVCYHCSVNILWILLNIVHSHFYDLLSFTSLCVSTLECFQAFWF